MSAREQLRSAVIANRRMLQLLDRQIEEAMKLEPEVFVGLADPDRQQPFSYIVEGVDKLPGIEVPQAAPVTAIGYQNPFFGYIRIQSDAAFVATKIFACGANDIDGTEREAISSIAFRAYDEGAGRWLLLANSRERVQQDSAIPMSVFGQMALASPGGLELPSECVFPRNGLIRVEAYVLRNTTGVIPPPSTRIYFILHGYKVFGG